MNEAEKRWQGSMRFSGLHGSVVRVQCVRASVRASVRVA